MPKFIIAALAVLLAVAGALAIVGAQSGPTYTDCAIAFAQGGHTAQAQCLEGRIAALERAVEGLESRIKLMEARPVPTAAPVVVANPAPQPPSGDATPAKPAPPTPTPSDTPTATPAPTATVAPTPTATSDCGPLARAALKAAHEAAITAFNDANDANDSSEEELRALWHAYRYVERDLTLCKGHRYEPHRYWLDPPGWPQSTE